MKIKKPAITTLCMDFKSFLPEAETRAAIHLAAVTAALAVKFLTILLLKDEVVNIGGSNGAARPRLGHIMTRSTGWEAVMESSLPRKIAKMTRATGAIAAATALVLVMVSAGLASAKKKEKVYLPDFVLKAQTVLVVILPDAGEPMNDPFANRKAQEEVEKAVMKWGRYGLALDTDTADLVIGVRKGTGQAASPTINGGPVDTRPGTIETTDSQIRIGGQQGRPPSTTQAGDAGGMGGKSAPNDRPHRGVELGAEDDTFLVFQGGVQYPVDYPAVWKYIAKDGLKPPGVAAVEQFRKAVEESEKAAAQKQQQQQPQGQKKNP